MISNYIDELYTALRTQRPIAPLAARDPSLSLDDAYAISLGLLERRLADGERVVGKKIGVTSKAVQDMLGVHQPDFGFLTDAMWINGDIDLAALGLIQPRAEAEVAFFLRTDLRGTAITGADVIDATESIAACFEIVDSRIANWQIGIIDTVADNASCGVFVLGSDRVDPRTLELADVHAQVRKNGAPLSQGYGAAVQGSPAEAVAWLANTLGSYGVTLNSGDIILSGSLVPLAPARAGDVFELIMHGVGGCTARFT